MIRAALRLVAVGACALALSGCISLLPKSKPAQLYRFGQTTVVATGPATGTVGVFHTNGTFASEAGGDRILTLGGGKAAYIAQSRWVAPAAVLWNEAVVRAFEADNGKVRLVSRGQQTRAAYTLRMDVRNFETRYDEGSNRAPTVLVRVRAVLTSADFTKTAEQVFEAKAPATDNRVGAIVGAYDTAVNDVLGQIVAWTNAGAS
jgi:cholesterol transport system auxiliary component